MIPTVPGPARLLPLSTSPIADAAGWAEVAAHGPGTVALIRLDAPTLGMATQPAATVPAATVPGATVPCTTPADRWPETTWTALAAAIERLVRRGVRPLVGVDLDYGHRPLADILTEIGHWSLLPVAGVFLDHAPTSPHQSGAVVHAVRAARRAGFSMIVVNPGAAVDGLYRRLNVIICTFEGAWDEYVAWSANRASPGDCHLVYGVAPGQLDEARSLLAQRQAGLMLVSGAVPQFAAAVPR